MMARDLFWMVLAIVSFVFHFTLERQGGNNLWISFWACLIISSVHKVGG